GRAPDRRRRHRRDALGAELVGDLPVRGDDRRPRRAALGPARDGRALMELADRITARAAGRPRALAGALGVLGLVGGIAALGLLLPVSEALSVEDAVGVSVFALATNLLLGYGGVVCFGQAAFYGSGGYLVPLGWRHWHWSFWLARA